MLSEAAELPLSSGQEVGGLLGLTLLAGAYLSLGKPGTSLTGGQTLLSGLRQDTLVRGAFLTQPFPQPTSPFLTPQFPHL